MMRCAKGLSARTRAKQHPAPYPPWCKCGYDCDATWLTSPRWLPPRHLRMSVRDQTSLCHGRTLPPAPVAPPCVRCVTQARHIPNPAGKHSGRCGLARSALGMKWAARLGLRELRHPSFRPRRSPGVVTIANCRITSRIARATSQPTRSRSRIEFKGQNMGPVGGVWAMASLTIKSARLACFLVSSSAAT